MGKFMLNFADDEISPVQPQPVEPKIQFVTKAEEPSGDGLFQKTLCYASYYVMTFSAFCAFAPGQVAHAADMVKSVLPG
ncbi:MAG: hypothetical protein ACR2O3_02510 [Rhizobiaceae bacterium]